MNKITYLLLTIFMGMSLSSVAMERVDFLVDDEYQAAWESASFQPVQSGGTLSVLETLLQERLEKGNISTDVWALISASETPYLGSAHALNVGLANGADDESTDAKIREWNLFRYERLVGATLAVIDALRAEVIKDGDEVARRLAPNKKNPSYQYQLRAAYVALMFTLEEFDNALTLAYKDADPYPETGMIKGMVSNVQEWGSSLYGRVTDYVYSKDTSPLRTEGKVSKAELARRYHLARNGLSSMREAWKTAGWNGAQSVREIAQAFASPLQMAEDAKDRFKALTRWFGAANPKNIFKMSLAGIRQGVDLNDSFGIVEFARKYPLLARDLAANMMLFYNTLAMDRSTSWAEVLGSFETIYQFKEAENIANDFLLGSEDYLYSSVDIKYPPIPPALLVLSQLADWLPYAAGAYIGLTTKSGINGWIAAGIQSIPFYGPVAAKIAESAACAGAGIAIVHLQKKAASKISREHEIMVNMLRHSFKQIYGGERDLKKLAGSAFGYLGMREAIYQYGTYKKLSRDKRLCKECGFRIVGTYAWDVGAGELPKRMKEKVKKVALKAVPTLVTGTSGVIGYFGFGTLWRYYLEVDPDFSFELWKAAPFIAMGASALVLPVIVHNVRDWASWCVGGSRIKTRKEAQRLRQLEHQRENLPVVCLDAQNDDGQQRFAEAAKKLTSEELVELAKEDLDSEKMLKKLTSKVFLIVDDQDPKTLELEAELAKSNPEFRVLKERLEALKTEAQAEYRAGIDAALQLFKHGRLNSGLDRFEKEIVEQLKALRELEMTQRNRDAILEARKEQIDAILVNIDKLRVRQLKTALWDRLEASSDDEDDDTQFARQADTRLPVAVGEMQDLSEVSPLVPKEKEGRCTIL